MTSAKNEIILAVSLTVSPWAICDFSSSRSWMLRPRRLHADENEKRVRVELSLNTETAKPESNTFGEILLSLIPLSISATWKMAASSSSVLSQVRKKSFKYMFSVFFKDNFLMFSISPILSILILQYVSII